MALYYTSLLVYSVTGILFYEPRYLVDNLSTNYQKVELRQSFDAIIKWALAPRLLEYALLKMSPKNNLMCIVFEQILQEKLNLYSRI